MGCTDCRYPPKIGTEHMYILIDTNGFMVPAQFHVDIFSELRRLGYSCFIVPRSVLFELSVLSESLSCPDKTAAKVALSLAKKCLVAEIEGYADDVILKEAVSKKISVLTNDAPLRKKLKKKNITVVSLRQQTHLTKID